MINEDDNDLFISLHTKYYTIKFDYYKLLCGQPAINDITNQYLYQLSYKDFVKKNNIFKVKNCFLTPVELDLVIKKSNVWKNLNCTASNKTNLFLLSRN